MILKPLRVDVSGAESVFYKDNKTRRINVRLSIRDENNNLTSSFGILCQVILEFENGDIFPDQSKLTIYNDNDKKSENNIVYITGEKNISFRINQSSQSYQYRKYRVKFIPIVEANPIYDDIMPGYTNPIEVKSKDPNRNQGLSNTDNDLEEIIKLQQEIQIMTLR